MRELRNAIESMFLMASGDSIGLDELPPEIESSSASSAGEAGPRTPAAIGRLEDAELEFIRKTLETDQGNLTLVAKHLGIAKSTLYIKLKKYGLERALNGARGSGR